MNSDLSQWTDLSFRSREHIRQIILDCGASKVGFSVAGSISPEEEKLYGQWLQAGRHGQMSYLENHSELRRDPRQMFENTATVISCAFDYRQASHHKLFSDYALGEDYHNVIRRRLKSAVRQICDSYNLKARICVDSAPVRERYWALRSYVGALGLNGQIFVDGIGSKIFLAEILLTLSLPPDKPSAYNPCTNCGLCISACPGNALDGLGGLDARKCLSYLTIEYRGKLPDRLHIKDKIYGCDVCSDVCPINQDSTTSSTPIAEFLPDEKLMKLDRAAISKLDEESFNQIFSKSAVRRTGLSGLKRNANHDF